MKSFAREIKDLPLFPVFPFVPIALMGGAVALSIWSLTRVRKLSRELAARSA